MGRILRISGLVLFIALLVLMVPDNIRRLSAGANFKITSPVVNSSRVRTAPNVRDFLASDPPSATPTSQVASVPQQDVAIGPKQALVQPDSIAAANLAPVPPTREPTYVLPAENHALEAREVRRALSARTATPVPDPHDTPQCLAPEPMDVFIHLPPGAAQHQPLRVLLVLHGMGARGDAFAQELLATADRNNWVVVAPTFPYNKNYLDATLVMQEDLQLTRSLHAMLDNLPKRLGLKLHQHVLIYGFSRGAQLGHRLALFFPEHVESIAVFAAGSYTLPEAKDGTNGTRIMSFPYGLSDVNRLLGSPEDWNHLKTLSFWIGVGGKDNRTGDVARAFDAYVGQNRLDRARNFYKALQDAGVDAHLAVFPNADHEITSEMRAAALDFLRQDELADNWND